jgi:flagella basal body P-ring formation protein FlgA
MNKVNSRRTKSCFSAIAAAAAVFCQATAAANEAGSEWQSAESIRTAAERHVAATDTARRGRTIVTAAALDARLRLPACAEALQTETPYGRTRGKRVTVRVSCEGVPAWKIHVPVDVDTIGSVVTTVHGLARGAVLQRSDLVLSETELGRLGHGYFLDPTLVVGQRLKRPMPAGTILTPNLLEVPAAVKRGQTVTIVANTGGIGVKMNGKALEDGALGQVIDIENATSGRRLQGIVRSARSVEILLR